MRLRLILLLLLAPLSARAATVLVVQQEGVEAYAEAVEGLSQQLGDQMYTWSGVPGRATRASLLRTVRRQRPKLVVAVGRWAAVMVREVDLHLPALYAMVLDPAADHLKRPPFVGGISLAPSQADQLRFLHRVAPAVHRLTAVVAAGQGERWAATALPEDGAGITVTTLALSVEALPKVCDEVEAARAEAVWLPAEGGLLSPAAFDYLRRCAVDDRLPLLVPTAALVARGALLAVYSDYFESGLLAGEMAHRWLTGKGASFGPPARIALAVNRTVAATLGIPLSRKVLSEALVVVDGDNHE